MRQFPETRQTAGFFLRRVLYDSSLMNPADRQEEHRRLSEQYREMPDEELENIASEAYDLTEVAQECLRFEISSRGLKIPLKLTGPSDDEPEPLPPTDDGFVPDDQDLVVARIVHSMDELLRIKSILERAQIECFFGDQKTRDVNALPADFHGDVDIRVWRAQAAGVKEIFKATIPDFDKAPNDETYVEVRCPMCNSDGVIFEERDLESTDGKLTNQSKFRWVCDDCGHEWEDDGIADEAFPERADAEND
jgi:DNA-directed RNA polymerase subunit M/transcription elongation factor TFIIS